MEQITIKEVAKLCGVGVSTVSRAINNHPDINQETKQKILDIIKEYNYIPNNSARNLKRNASKTIAVLVKGISNPFFGTIFQVLEREVKRKKYSFVLQHVEEDEDEVEVAIKLEKEKKPRGMVFLGGKYNHQLENLRQLTVPFVISTANMQLPKGEMRCAVVSVDDEAESYRMVSYLCEQGHKKIAILAATREDASIGCRRLAGYERALRDHGLPYDEELVMWSKKPGDTYSVENGYEMAKELLESGKEFSCIYGVADTLAIGACKAVFEAGKRIPEDYSVAGFDGLDMAYYYHPSITTICQPREEMAMATIRVLFQMMEEEEVEPEYIYEAKLLVGESTAKVG